LLFGVSPADPTTFMMATGVALLMTIAGSIVPTWRAVRVNPLTAIRAE
jgi:ABC-type lipoprotein release transport system permease subunit